MARLNILALVIRNPRRIGSDALALKFSHLSPHPRKTTTRTQQPTSAQISIMVLSPKDRIIRLLKLIVVNYVPECVRHEYTSMFREASTLLLDALESMINHYFMDKIQSEMMQGSTSSLGVVWLSGKTIADNPSCPLTCLLSGNSTMPIYQETVRISVWGGLTSSLAHNPFTLSCSKVDESDEDLSITSSVMAEDSSYLTSDNNDEDWDDKSPSDFNPFTDVRSSLDHTAYHAFSEYTADKICNFLGSILLSDNAQTNI